MLAPLNSAEGAHSFLNELPRSKEVNQLQRLPNVATGTTCGADEVAMA